MIYGATLSTVAAPPPISDDDALAVLMLALSPDLYLRHGDTENVILYDSSGEDNDAAVVGSFTSWGVDAELADPANLGRAINYGGDGSASILLSALNAVTYGIRFKPAPGDRSNSVAIMGRNTAGNNAGNWSLRLLSGGAVRVFFQDGAVQTTLESASGLIEADTWAHIYVVMSGAGVALYVNGELIASSNAHTTGEIGTSLPLVIGASNYTSNFGGTVHEVVRYPSALTAMQIEDRSFGTTASPPPDPEEGDAFVQLPAMTSSVTVSTRQALIDAVAAAPPGRHILVQPGNYTGFAVTFGGASGAPVVIRPANKNNPPRFTGTHDFYGTFGQVWGIIFDNTAGGSSAGTKNIRKYGTDIRIMYCDIKPAGIAYEIASTAPRRSRAERNYLWGKPSGATGNGHEAFKLGVSASLTVPHATVVTLNYMVGFYAEREMVSMKGEASVQRNHSVGGREWSTRHSRGCLIEENRIESPASGTGRIQISGPDHVVRGNVCTSITVDRGTHDGDTNIAGSGSVRLAAKRTVLQNNTVSGAFVVGDNPFSSGSWPIAVTGTTASGNNKTPSTALGASVGTAATVESNPPPTLSNLTTGVLAYATYVTGA